MILDQPGMVWPPLQKNQLAHKTHILYYWQVLLPELYFLILTKGIFDILSGLITLIISIYFGFHHHSFWLKTW